MNMEEKSVNFIAAIRCAKAAFLLSWLSNRHIKAAIDNEDEENEMMEREIRDLKMELVRERMKREKIKLYGLMEMVVEVTAMVMVLASTLILMLAFNMA